MSQAVSIYTPETFKQIAPKMVAAGYAPEVVARELSFAVQIINRTPKLKQCSKESLFAAVLNIANVGLTLNPAAKEAYLIPRWANGGNEAALEPSYVGLVKLLTEAGGVKSLTCQLVYKNDAFSVDLANNREPVAHRVGFGDRGGLVGVYALATLADGTRQVEIMDVAEVRLIMERSETYKAYKAGKINSATWVTDFNEMARKTVIKRVYKYLPRTDKMSRVDEAVNLDNSDFGITERQEEYITNLLASSTLDERERESLEMELSVMSSARAGQVIEHLQLHQLDPVSGKGNASAGELNQFLKNRVGNA